MRNFIFTYNSKATNNGWSYEAVSVWEIKKGELIHMGNHRYTFNSKMQAVCNFLAKEIKQYRKFPKSFIVPKNAELSKDKTQLHYSNGFTQSYCEWLVSESRYTEKPKQISIREVSLPYMGKKR